jgi:hypothetical protein
MVANARLIAAAPELVEVLYEIQHLAAMSGDAILPNARKRIHDLASQAIARAEGK